MEEITFEDLQKNEVEALQEGLLQLLPQRDRAGRSVIFIPGPVAVKYEVLPVVSICLFYEGNELTKVWFSYAPFLCFSYIMEDATLFLFLDVCNERRREPEEWHNSCLLRDWSVTI